MTDVVRCHQLVRSVVIASVPEFLVELNDQPLVDLRRRLDHLGASVTSPTSGHARSRLANGGDQGRPPMTTDENAAPRAKRRGVYARLLRARGQSGPAALHYVGGETSLSEAEATLVDELDSSA